MTFSLLKILNHKGVGFNMLLDRVSSKSGQPQKINTDTERKWVFSGEQRLQLRNSVQQWLGSISQDEARIKIQCKMKNVNDFSDDKRFPSGKRELLCAKLYRFLDKWLYVL